MALPDLPDLLPFFYFQFKNGVTIPALAPKHHAFALRLVSVPERHYVSTFRTLYPDGIFHLFNIRSPLTILLSDPLHSRGHFL